MGHYRGIRLVHSNFRDNFWWFICLCLCFLFVNFVFLCICNRLNFRKRRETWLIAYSQDKLWQQYIEFVNDIVFVFVFASVFASGSKWREVWLIADSRDKSWQRWWRSGDLEFKACRRIQMNCTRQKVTWVKESRDLIFNWGGCAVKMSKLKDLPKSYDYDETKGDMSHRVRRSPSLLKM